MKIAARRFPVLLILAAAVVLYACSGGSKNAVEGEDFASSIADQRSRLMATVAPSQSQWSGVTTLSLVPSFAATLPSGKVLLFSADSKFSFTVGPGGMTYSTIYDPATNTSSDTLVSNTGHEMFCSGTSNLADGRLLIAGGGDDAKTSIYDPARNAWSASGQLNIPRAYNSNTVLADGAVLTLGGSWLGGAAPKNAELWSPSTGTWSQLSGVPVAPFLEPGQSSPEPYVADSHLWLIPAGNGKTFHAGPGEAMHWIDTRGNGSVTSAGMRGDDAFAFHGNTVMYDTGKVLKVGGSPQNMNAPSSAAAYVVNLNAGVNVRKINPMNYARSYQNSVVLPNGQVVILGGMTVGGQFTDSNSVMRPELFDPVTETFTALPPMAIPRNYHSVAVLLADARVLVAGGGLCGAGCAANHPDLQILTPNYLLNTDGTPAPRPAITSAPGYASYGSTINVSTDSAVAGFSLVRLAATTHTVNNDQRRLSLTFGSNGANSYQIDMPSNPGWAVPGTYMLFAMNANGTPSVAKMITIGGNGAPTLVAPDSQASFVGFPVSFGVQAGANGGPTISYSATGLPPGLAINAATGVVAGTPTTQGTYFPTIVVSNGGSRVSSTLQWDINSATTAPVAGPVYGATGAGASFTDSGGGALTGVNVRGGWWLDNIQGVRASGTLAPHGGAGGSAAGFTVPAGQYLVRMYGIAGDSAITQISFVTNTGQTFGPYGQNQGQTRTTPFDYTVPTGMQIVGFTGSAGQYLNAIGVLYAPVTSAPVVPVIATPVPPTSYVGVETSVTLSASEPGNGTLTYAATGLPPGLLINAATGVIAGFPTTAGTYVVNATVSDGNGGTASTSFNWVIQPPIPVIRPVSAPSIASGGTANYTVDAGAGNFSYTWNFGDGSPTTQPTTANTASYTYATPGVYTVTVSAASSNGTVVTRNFVQAVTSGRNTGASAARSSDIAVEKRKSASDRLWVVNPDNGSVSVIDTAGNTLVGEIPVGSQPRTVAIRGTTAIVTNREGASLSVISTDTLAVLNTVALPRGSQPYGVIVGPDGSTYVGLEATGQVLKFDGSLARIASVAVPGVRHLAMSADGSRLFASRFITAPQPGESTKTVLTSVNGQPTGGAVTELDPASLAKVRQFVLQFSALPDTLVSGRGVPNYLGAPAISPDGANAWVPSKQDNIQRGAYRDGKPLDFETTVRAITSHLDLAANTEDLPGRVFHLNSGFTTAAAYHPNGAYLFVALETSREIAVLDAAGRRELLRVAAGRAPDGLGLSSDGTKLYVNNFMDRTVSVYDLNPLLQFGNLRLPQVATIAAIGVEKLPANVLLGKQFFYDAQDPRLARDRWMSCASCHNEGGGDGRVWDFTSLGEGLRDTISLLGRAGGHGNKHWSANFDEIQDFEGQIRVFEQGTGLMTNAQFNTGTRSQPLGDPKAGVSADLDALAAYVTSLDVFSPSPYRNQDGTLTSAALAGKAVFAANCASCHGGVNFTDSFTFAGTSTADLRDIGTLYPGSGKRLGGVLPGFDTPTLRDVWATAPYLHDGSAPTVDAAIAAHTNVSLSAADLASVTAYVLQIGGDEAYAPGTFVTGPTYGAPAAGTAFSDPVRPGQPLVGVNLRGGWWLDNIQGVTGSGALPSHGGTGGTAVSFRLPAGQYLVRVYGMSGVSNIDKTITQIAFVSNTGQTYGPYGSNLGQTTSTPFDYTVPAGKKIYGFAGASGKYLNAVSVIYGP
ncbi:jacalin-like lectin [Burkholderia pyrrocinia]|uniref:jacalin-like lectin n=1 Tax=Burkholderia pyrrocinia TaxID=60550 RepID=UPI002AB1E278|nr:galactose oxidase-like domain-containing protein [Burkholderia pyrrocinia]